MLITIYFLNPNGHEEHDVFYERSKDIAFYVVPFVSVGVKIL